MGFFDPPKRPELTVAEALEFAETLHSRKLDEYAREQRAHGVRTTLAAVGIWCFLALAVIGLATVVNGLR